MSEEMQEAGSLVDDTWLYKLYDASWRMGYATATKHEADFQQAYNDKNVAVTEMETELESYRRQLAECQRKLSVCEEYADKLRGEKAELAEQFYRARAGLPEMDADNE